MIKIANTVTVHIGENKSFEIVVKRLSPTQQKKLELISEKHNVEHENAQDFEKKNSEIMFEISEVQGTIDVNTDLLKLPLSEMPLKDRVTLLWENKTLLTKLFFLKKEQAKLKNPDYLKSFELVEELWKERFELSVEDGEQKEALRAYASQMSVSFSELFTEINAEIKKDEAKKLKALVDGQK